MANNIYLILNGKKQGLVSAGCSTFDSIGNSFQRGHKDHILVQELHHTITREQNVSHHPVSFKKPIDKSTPLLISAISNNEEFDAVFEYYRTDTSGSQVLYYKIKLTKSFISDISTSHPNSISHNDAQPFAIISLKYQSITCEHITAGTSGYSIWDERVY